MDPDNLFRGPRRALRHGDSQALRYDRLSYPATEGTDANLETPTARNDQDASMESGSGGRDPRFQSHLFMQHRMQGEVWARDVDGDEQSSAEETSSAGEVGDGSESEGLAPEYGELADEDLIDDQDGDFEFGSQHDIRNDEQLISFDPMLLGLKEINNLAHFSVSSHKPGNGVDELLSDDLDKYWQSDGPQPHLLTIHFLRRVEIRAIRFHVDYNLDESYTPTFVSLSAGTGHHDLIEFASLALTSPIGWQEIDLSNAGGGDDGQSLCCWIVQVKVKENHQNGKDTHIRGIKIYAIDENAPPADSALDELAKIKARTLQSVNGQALEKDDYLFERIIAQSPDRLPGIPERSGSMSKFMRDPEIR